MENMLENNIFSEYINKQTLFLDKTTLTASFIPNKISHRDDELQQLSSILAPIIKGYNPNNIFVYGTCGTGKTICLKFIMKHLSEITKN